MKIIYNCDPVTGKFLFSSQADVSPMEEGVWLIPANAYLDPPPSVRVRECAVREGGQWKIVPEYHGIAYRTDNGDRVELDILGELPSEFTLEPRPTEFHTWNGKGWVKNDDFEFSELCKAERIWRNVEIQRVQWLFERHRDESEIGIARTLDPDSFTELLIYIQALRDWPGSELFPVRTHRPVVPALLMLKVS